MAQPAIVIDLPGSPHHNFVRLVHAGNTGSGEDPGSEQYTMCRSAILQRQATE